MPKPLMQYRVFIGSPGGLNEERKEFRDKLHRFTTNHAEPRDVVFHPVGWEDTLGGVGRPQELINEDLKQCDYAVFVLHDRWGSPTGSGYSSGTEEEWRLAEQLYKEAKIRNIALFFKDVDPRQLRDPGEQLKQVLNFKKAVEADKKYLFKQYAGKDEFCEALETHLAKWLRDHEGRTTPGSSDRLGSPTPAPLSDVASPTFETTPSPGFDYWIAEARGLLDEDPSDNAGALFCARKAEDESNSEIRWAEAKYLCGVAHSRLKDLTQSVASFSEIAERLEGTDEPDKRVWQAKALFNKGATLDQLGRGKEAITAYDEVLTRFGTASALPLQEQVAQALLNKSMTLGQLDRSEEEITVYDDLVARFATATELPLRARVAWAINNKGIVLGDLGRNLEGLRFFDDVVARFGGASELQLRRPVAQALVNKGVGLGELGRCEEEIAAYDQVLAQFGSATELPLRELVAVALYNKGFTLGQLGRGQEEIKVYDNLLAQFSTASEMPLREQVAGALFNKGVALDQLGRRDEAITVYDDVVARFSTASELPLREEVAKALFNKGITLGQLGRSEEAIKVYDDLVARFGTAKEGTFTELCNAAQKARELLIKKGKASRPRGKRRKS